MFGRVVDISEVGYPFVVFYDLIVDIEGYVLFPEKVVISVK